MMQLDGWTIPEVCEQRMLEWARAYRQAVEKVEAFGSPVFREEPKEQLHYTGEEDEVERRKPIFKPPLHKQRIQFAIRQIQTFVKEKGPFKKLVVIGCGDLVFERNCMDKFHLWGVDSVVSYDINRANLFRNQACFNREIGTEKHGKYDGVPCVMDVWKGDGTQYHSCLEGADVVVCIEVIEHMPVKSAEELMRVMLDLIQPKLAVVSTPNYDYNKYIPDMKTQFRDPDHDYEFTKKEFEEWLQKVNRPQHYTYEIDFVGFLDRQPFDYYDDDDDPYELSGKPINEPIAEPARFSRGDDVKDESYIDNHSVLVAGNDNGGATQIAIFKRLPTSEPLTVTDRSHHSFERAYSLVIPYGFHTVLRAHVQQAMIAYLKTDRLLSCATRELNYIYYLVPFKDVMEYASNEEYRFVMERFQDHSCSIIHRASHQFIHTTTEPMLPGSPHHQKGFRIPNNIPVKELLDYLEDFDW